MGLDGMGVWLHEATQGGEGCLHHTNVYVRYGASKVLDRRAHVDRPSCLGDVVAGDFVLVEIKRGYPIGLMHSTYVFGGVVWAE